MTTKRQRGQTHPGQVGEAAEQAVIRYLTQTGQLARDVRAEPDYQLRDIDLIRTDGQTVEVKGDTWLHKTGNLFFETVRDNYKAGCFYRSKADWWYYCDTESGDCYAFRLSEAQAWLVRHVGAEGVEWTLTRSHRQGEFRQFGGYKVRLDALQAGIAVLHLRLGVLG